MSGTVPEMSPCGPAGQAVPSPGCSGGAARGGGSHGATSQPGSGRVVDRASRPWSDRPDDATIARSAQQVRGLGAPWPWPADGRPVDRAAGTASSSVPCSGMRRDPRGVMDRARRGRAGPSAPRLRGALGRSGVRWAVALGSALRSGGWRAARDGDRACRAPCRWLGWGLDGRRGEPVARSPGRALPGPPWRASRATDERAHVSDGSSRPSGANDLPVVGLVVRAPSRTRTS